MTFELLANELLLDLFEYLRDNDLFRSFYGLNYRLNTLLLTHKRTYYLNFQSIYRKDFNLICNKILPIILNRILSLNFYDDDETCQQIDIFYSNIFLQYQFENLQSLSFYQIHSKQTLDNLLNILSHFQNLHSLTLIGTYIFIKENDQIIYLFNQIWNLPKLIYCKLQNISQYNSISIAPTIISLSLKYLIIDDVNDLINLSEKTPQLYYLQTSIERCFHMKTDFFPFSSSIIKLKLLCNHLLNLIHFLMFTPHLTYLYIDLFNDCIDGNQWKKLINQYLPKLQIFKLKMQFEFDHIDQKEEKLNDLLQSFRTPFWLIQHQWFVRCYYRSHSTSINCILCTIPHHFSHFNCTNDLISKSTYPDDKYFLFKDKVKYLNYNSIVSPNFSLIPIHFLNIYSIHLKTPFKIQLANFEQLKSLYISHLIDREDNEIQLQNLINQIPDLYSLKFRSWSIITKLPMNIEKKSIRRLDLTGLNYHFNEKQCEILSQSLLGIQCEVLLISLPNRMCIIKLINRMKNLRAMKVICLDEIDEYPRTLVKIKDDFISWLQDRLPSTCIMTVDNHRPKIIRLWIR